MRNCVPAECFSVNGKAVPPPDVVDGDSDFMQAVSSRAPEQAWAIVDELMDALKVTNARMYDNVMRKMRG